MEQGSSVRQFLIISPGFFLLTRIIDLTEYIFGEGRAFQKGGVQGREIDGILALASVLALPGRTRTYEAPAFGAAQLGTAL